MAGATVTWSSADAGIASVNTDGVVTGVSAGTVTITARSGGKTATSSVSVVASTPADGDIVVNAGRVFQEMAGWEATAWVGQWACGGQYPTSLYDAYAPVVFDLAADLGINRLRLTFRSGAERPTDLFPAFVAGNITPEQWRNTWYEAINDNGSATSINSDGFHFGELDLEVERVVEPLRQRLAARGEDLYVSLNFTDFSRSSTFEHQREPAEYAELMLAAFQHLQSRYGWVPDGVEIILEPDNGDPTWNGHMIGDAIVATGNRLKAAGYSPEFIAPSGKGIYWTLSNISLMMSVPGVAQYISEFAYHRYGGGPADAIEAMADLGETHGVRTSMLEHIGSGYLNLHEDLTLGRVSAWQQYALAGCAPGDPGGRYFLIDASNPSNPVVTTASRTPFLRQYFKWVRAGAIRVEATTSIGALDPLAFVNVNGKYVVVVKANQARDFTIGGLPAGEYGIAYTTGPDETSPQQAGVELPAIRIAAGEELFTGIPGRGVITIYAR